MQIYLNKILNKLIIRTSDSSEEKSCFDEGENDENILFLGSPSLAP
jgi:hypothetical protein